ncbi:MAG: sigma-70 family RNA polymerase sigma factor [Lutibacter sp.]|uniref:RNA polymerase sigma factor n=1 Tax=Lutibacter sp. TaxID=1925666 RepID=UPI00299F10EF|nr:sigma-70 family RNA polymerase sigma factor [Lutibacter sp.]MDX1828663.1 sigma-70 family RNA polymerase sigma factor [Lutibacter sp.]
MNKKERKFKDVYQQSKDKIYRLCLGFSGNKTDADDLFQEVYIKVWNNLHSFRNESNINTWIYRIASNTAILFIKNKKINNEKISQLQPENLRFENNEDKILDEEIMKLYQAIASLKEKDRIIISLLLEKSSYSEISKIVGISISNVGVRINRIKKTLTKKMNNYGR